jgi:peptidoglycan/LPS O-acetylase OafA/YrhL
MVEGKKSAAVPWPVRAVFVVLPLLLAVMGVATAIHLNDRGDKWPAALAAWTIGWFFALIALAAWEVTHGRPIFGRSRIEQPRWRWSEIIVLAVVLLAAALLRVVALESYPVALHNDEMSCLIEARGFLGGSPEVGTTARTSAFSSPACHFGFLDRLCSPCASARHSSDCCR